MISIFSIENIINVHKEYIEVNSKFSNRKNNNVIIDFQNSRLANSIGYFCSERYFSSNFTRFYLDYIFLETFLEQDSLEAGDNVHLISKNSFVEGSFYIVLRYNYVFGLDFLRRLKYYNLNKKKIDEHFTKVFSPKNEKAFKYFGVNRSYIDLIRKRLEERK